MTIASFRNRFVSIRNRFARDERGNVAMLFGLAIIPVMLFTGAAVDYSRALAERERIQTALDATAIALAKTPKGTSLTDLQALADKYFAATFRTTDGLASPAIAVSQNAGRIRLAATSSVETAFMRLAGWEQLPLAVDTEVTNDKRKIEIALVLDNTGSMGSAGKMPALKAAVNDLINQLQAKVTEPDDVKMSIVPFDTSVRISTAHESASWLRWDVVQENTSYGWWFRQPPAPAAWTGCIIDRDQPWDVTSNQSGIHDARYPTANCFTTTLAQMEPLTTNLEMIRTRADSMTPSGWTNVTIGLTMGMATLRNDTPFGAASSSASNVDKFLILLTDGDNTRNRWDHQQSPIDARLTAACNEARTSGVKIFTIRVINGNAPLLQSCATNPSMYYNVQNASELQPVFNQILNSIQGIRLTN